MTKYATPDSLSPEARKFYEESVEQLGKERSKIWLRYGHYVMDEDMNAVPAPFVEWAVQYDGENYRERQIRLDRIGEWYVSTVFLGLDHGFCDPEDPAYRPVLWESMIFWDGDKDACPWPDLIYEQDRYCSTAESIEGHAAMVKKLTDRLTPTT